MTLEFQKQDRAISARLHAEQVVPCMREHRGTWVVVHRKCNFSAFSGYRRTPSDYSLVLCTACGRRWRTKALYVDTLPDQGTSPPPGLPDIR
jgi:hypothetical protein